MNSGNQDETNLIPDSENTHTANVPAAPPVEVHALPIDYIISDPKQTRKEFPDHEIDALAESISKHGLVTPILVKAPNKDGDKYIIVDGERRYRALCKLSSQHPDNEDFKVVSVSIFGKDDPIYGIIANMARKIYNPMESAEALAYMQKHGGYSHEQLGRLVEKSRSSITEYLSLLDLPEVIKDKAKSESVVPFRALKKLAAEQISNEAKIDKYNKLHSKYSPSTQSRARKEDAKSAWTANRLAKGFQTKLKSILGACDKISIAEINDEEQKTKLKDSLDALMDKIKAMREELD